MTDKRRINNTTTIYGKSKQLGRFLLLQKCIQNNNSGI